MNSRITPKERGLLKGAIRRVFSRSDLRRKILDAATIAYFDPDRPRVKKWCACNVCKSPSPKYKTAIDHVQPVIPIDDTFENIGLDVTVDRTWCDENNLQAICESCHDIKTKQERKARKEAKNGTSKSSKKRSRSAKTNY